METGFWYILSLTIIGALGIFFIKGVLEIRATPEFNSVDFVVENRHRLAWLAFGVIVVATGVYFDPAGLEYIWEHYLPLPAQIGTPLAFGAALSALTLTIPRQGDS